MTIINIEGGNNMNANIEMLNYIYKNAQMGQNSINHLLDIVKEDSKFKNLLESQLKEYKNIFNTAEKSLNESGYEAKGTSAIQKFETYMMIDMKTLNNKTPDHIAEMLIQGSTMGVIQITRRLKDYDGGIDKNVQKLAEKLLSTEQHNVEECRKFLGKAFEVAHA